MAARTIAVNAGRVLAALLGLTGLACSLGTQKRDAVLGAVLAYELTQFADPGRPVVCLQTNDGRQTLDPSPEVMADLARHATVHNASACRVEPSGVTVAASREPAVLLSAGPIDWVAEHEAQVAGAYVRSAASAARPTYRVVRGEGGRWVCLGPIVKGLPL
jgi:hypothetical protein